MAGTLFVVATPIGNLEDLSFRALRTLREVDLIAAEDTRRTAKLLAHYEIRRPMVSLHAHNEHRESPRLVARLEAGESIALVSDAGTPGISDPGELLVRAARDHGIHVTPIPGPSAIMTALSVSGFAADEFVFMGFPPRSGSARKAWLERLAADPRTVVVFEAPHRITRTMVDLRIYLAERQILVHRELTKQHEEFIISPTSSTETTIKELGEFVIVVGKSTDKPQLSADSADQLDVAIKLVGCMTDSGYFMEEEAARLAGAALSIDQRRVKNAVKKYRLLQKRRSEALS